ncbi:ESPR-type extended signal peptide-containing protein [Burkholderia gladioli]|uniref:ESPR-type extended signal peptide-containing protein n=1 Tax=Burkholderia gladioli TaxID=28095 RepID=UPI001C26A816|nr:ESPR-type extended signal peptide-containing protein [Burkholderia gladioli]MBU9384310.1 hypothetical protein [Burkholderia gladioli]
MMNRSYKVVWNASSGAWAVASEVARYLNGRQAAQRRRIGYAYGGKAALVTMGVVVADVKPTSEALSGTVIGGGGNGGSHHDGGTNSTNGGLAKSYVGVAAQGTYAALDVEGAVALGTSSRANRANTVSVRGGIACTRQIVSVAAGSQGADAVNVGQLSGVVTALGAGAGIAADGSVKAPMYQVGDKTYGNVGDAIAAPAESGGRGMDPNAVAYDDEAKGSITLTVENGTKLKKLAAGDVREASTGAVNGSLLFSGHRRAWRPRWAAVRRWTQSSK